MTASEMQISKTEADREKRNVALSSVVAAIFLTAIKLIVGLTTGSLGILAEAAHSGLDLVAAAVTFFAVRISGRPADRRHTYGHGKIENLSALFETLLLLLTCVWIIYEAVQRLFVHSVEVEVNIWGFAVILVAIVVDFSRSRALSRVAKKHNSQALEADALHFSTDIWSSSVVLVGLGLVKLAELLRMPWLVKADAMAALAVAGIVIWVSVQLGRRTVAALLDEVPLGLHEELIQAVRVPGVVTVKQVRVRQSGPEAFVDVTLKAGRDVMLEQVHGLADRAETAVRAILPGADVVVHVEPVRTGDENIFETVRVLAARHGVSAHGLRVYDLLGKLSLELHVEVDDSLQLGEAHTQTSDFEKALRNALPSIERIVTHIEPVGETSSIRAATPADRQEVWQILRSTSAALGVDCAPHDVEVWRDGGELHVSFHCAMNANAKITAAHETTAQLEQALRDRLPNLGRVVIHVEPPEKNR